MVEPQASLPKEKAYSIAAALPRPCYSSLMEDLSSVCLRSEKRQPFSHNEHGAQHIAQQLTMLQQVPTHTHTHTSANTHVNTYFLFRSQTNTHSFNMRERQIIH